MNINSVEQYLFEKRPDIAWVSGPDADGEYFWDPSLENQTEIRNIINEAKLFLIQKDQRLWGEIYADRVVDLIGAKNLSLIEQNIDFDTVLLLQNLGIIKELLQTGALRTAYGIINKVEKSAVFPNYQEIFEIAKTEINDFLTSKGY